MAIVYEEGQADFNIQSESAPDGEHTTPARVSLPYLLEGVDRYKADRFEEWAIDFWSTLTRNYAQARARLWRMERLGLDVLVLEVERARLALWGAQVTAAQVLAQANTEQIELDYTDPAILKYFALWLWMTDHTESNEQSYELLAVGPLDWSLYLDTDLLNLPSFALR